MPSPRPRDPESGSILESFEGDLGSAPSSLVAKVAPPYEEIRQQMHALGLYEREVRFYQNFGEGSGISVPQCYFADVNVETGDFLLLLEDLSACREGDFWESNIEDVQQAIDGLAGMHARWWCSPKLREEASWLRQHDDVDYNQTLLGAVLRGVLPQVEAKFSEHFDGYLRDVGRKLADRWESFVAYREGEAFSLVHGDFHPKQLFFASERGGRFAVFDWQSVCAGPPAWDLSRILLMGLRPDAMREHLPDLLQRYRQGLLREGVEYPQETLELEVRKGLLMTLFITAFATATSDMSILEDAATSRGVDCMDRVFGDLSRALQDNRVHELLD